MNLFRRVPILLVFLALTSGCGASGEDASDSCDDAFNQWEKCTGENLAFRINTDCNRVNDAEDDLTGDCEDALIDFFECVADASCTELRFGNNSENCALDLATADLDCANEL